MIRAFVVVNDAGRPLHTFETRELAETYIRGEIAWGVPGSRTWRAIEMAEVAPQTTVSDVVRDAMNVARGFRAAQLLADCAWPKCSCLPTEQCPVGIAPDLTTSPMKGTS